MICVKRNKCEGPNKKEAEEGQMIEKIYKNKRMVICDNCGIGQECKSCADAIDLYERRSVWKKKLADGEWKHYCSKCQESEVEEG